ncbi:hypothetical protein SRHO_G00055590 [Serrasalmus rhombeus]
MMRDPYGNPFGDAGNMLNKQGRAVNLREIKELGSCEWKQLFWARSAGPAFITSEQVSVQAKVHCGRTADMLRSRMGSSASAKRSRRSLPPQAEDPGLGISPTPSTLLPLLLLQGAEPW